jgi:L-alanine-DL-glutamate epimerase-like enolase superfamily enzyme
MAKEVKNLIPEELRDGDKANFETLKLACREGNLALLSAIRKSDGANIALVCAMNMGNDEVGVVPLAVMIEGNPYELFEDPTAVEESKEDVR